MYIARSIPLSIRPSFWLLASFIAWMSSRNLLEFGLWIIVVFVSVLVHELGHALCARYWNQKAHIELGPFGGLTVRRGPALGKWREFVTILMGPLFGFMLAAFAFCLLMFSPQKMALIYLLEVLVYANVFWSILNLVPVHPLDGGKLMSIGFEALFGLTGVRFSYLASAIFSLVLMGVFFIFGSLIGVVLFLLFAYESFHAFMQEKHVRSSGEDEKILSDILEAERQWHSGDREQAVSRLQKIIDYEAKGQVYYQALEMLIAFLLAEEQNERAYGLLMENKSKLSGPLLHQMQIASYRLHHDEEALAYGKKAFLEDQDCTAAILNVYISLRLSQIQEAKHWLKAVKRIDLDAYKKVLESEELASIRGDL